jgi:hypothetical protein
VDADFLAPVLLNLSHLRIDGAGIHGATGTVLAQVLHRKRPAFIPLYDSRVYGVYVGGNPALVPKPSGSPRRPEAAPDRLSTMART